MNNNTNSNFDVVAAEDVFQQFKHVKPRLNKAAIALICETYESAKKSAPKPEMGKETAYSALQGYLSALQEGDVVTQVYINRLNDYYLPRLRAETTPAPVTVDGKQAVKAVLDLYYEDKTNTFDAPAYVKACAEVWGLTIQESSDAG